LKNPDGRQNKVFTEARGRLPDVALGVLQNQDFWVGEGDEMIFLDNEVPPPSSAPAVATACTASMAITPSPSPDTSE
jgi:hypothetical protein